MTALPISKKDILGYKNGFPVVKSEALRKSGLTLVPIKMKKSSASVAASSKTSQKTTTLANQKSANKKSTNKKSANKKNKSPNFSKALTIFNEAIRQRRVKGSFQITKDERSEKWSEIKEMVKDGQISISKTAIGDIVKNWN